MAFVERHSKLLYIFFVLLLKAKTTPFHGTLKNVGVSYRYDCVLFWVFLTVCILSKKGNLYPSVLSVVKFM